MNEYVRVKKRATATLKIDYCRVLSWPVLVCSLSSIGSYDPLPLSVQGYITPVWTCYRAFIDRRCGRGANALGVCRRDGSA